MHVDGETVVPLERSRDAEPLGILVLAAPPPALRSKLARWLRGSVADLVGERLPCNVLIIRPG